MIMKYLREYCQQQQLKQQIAANRNKLYRMVYAWGHNPDLAHDIAQECMVKALHNLKQLRDPASLNSWLFGILVNCWRDHFRRQREMLDIDTVSLSHQETPEHLQHRQDMIDRVQHAVNRLPEGQRLAVTLVDLEGFSYNNVADMLGIPVGTVMSRLSRARAQLANMLLPAQRPVVQPAPVKLRSIT